MPKLPESTKEIYSPSKGPEGISLGDVYWTVDSGTVPSANPHKVVEITKITREVTTSEGTKTSTEYRYRLDSGRMFQNPFSGIIMTVYKSEEQAHDELRALLESNIEVLTKHYEETKCDLIENANALRELNAKISV